MIVPDMASIERKPDSHTTGHTGHVPGGSNRLSFVRNVKSRETERVEVVVTQGLLDRQVSGHAPEPYGEQEGSAYNGHFGCTCYHPLFLFNQFEAEKAQFAPLEAPRASWRHCAHYLASARIARHCGVGERDCLVFRRPWQKP
jgi:hypothetical protein